MSAESGGAKLALMGAFALLMIEVGVTGRLGSILGAIIDPANMQDSSSGAAGGETSGGSGGFASGDFGATATLTPSQIKAVAKAAGFSGGNLTIAVAVALAESGGEVGVTSPLNSNGTVDRGLWQINSVHTQYDATKLLTAAYNANAAYAVSNNGTNWYPWSTFTNGDYIAHMAAAKAA